MTVDIPEVLFVCIHNAGRSQMAAGLLNHRAQGSLRVRSAGSEPASSLNPAVVEAMTEIGIDISQEFPKPLTDEGVRAADVVITMGCGDACPIYPGKIYRDWKLTDPAGRSLPEVRAIRDDIDRRVQELIVELTARPPGPRAETGWVGVPGGGRGRGHGPVEQPRGCLVFSLLHPLKE